jgi:hypothetical protein
MKRTTKKITSKYPRILAETETKSRRSYDFKIVKVEPETDRDLITNPNAFTLQNVYPYNFDGITALCTDYADKEFMYKGERTKIIQGQNEAALTHYQAIVPVDIYKELTLNGHYEYWEYVRVELYKMHKNPEKRLLPFSPGLLIATHPLEVDFVYEDGTKVNVMKNLENIGADRRVQFLVLRFYKPLFESILQKNKKGTMGSNYLQMPRAMHAEINSTLKELERRFKSLDLLCPSDDDNVSKFTRAIIENHNNNPPDGWTYIPICDYKANLEAIISLTAIEARKIFLFLACHDDKQSNFISINNTYDDFLVGCFPGLVEQRKTGKIYVKPENKKLITKKLEGFIYLCNLLGEQGKLNGAQFLPCVFDIQNKRVKVIRSKNLCYNKQMELDFQG